MVAFARSFSLVPASVLVFLCVFWSTQNADALVRHEKIRVRRQTPAVNTVELLVVVDKADFDKALARNGQNVGAARQEMERYISGLIKEVNERLASLDSSSSSTLVRVRLANIIFLTTAAESSLTEVYKNGLQVNGDSALAAFSSLANVLTYAYPHDYAILLTGYDVRRGDGSDADVRTFLKGVCSNLKQGIVEDLGVERTAWVIAKGLGLTLGAEVDGTGTSANCPSGFYVMSSTFNVPTAGLDTQPFTYSSCSAAAVQSYLTNPLTQCLRTTNVANPLDTTQYTGTELGQSFNADAQCARLYGTGSAMCRDQYGVSSLFTYDFGFCRDMRCTSPTSSFCQTPGTLPFDGTSCGTQKWCQDGICVGSPLAPVAPSATCPQGDQPAPAGVPACQASLCAVSPAVYTSFTCCATCGSGLTPQLVSVAGAQVTAAGVSIAGATAAGVSVAVVVATVSIAAETISVPGVITPAPGSVAGLGPP